MEVDERIVRFLFDAAVGSMDFGSGFLDDEEVAGLREAAALLGVDPMEATPSNFKCKYHGKHMGAYPFMDHCIFTSFADGEQKNAYDKVVDGVLVMQRAPLLGMSCSTCGGRWGPLV